MGKSAKAPPAPDFEGAARAQTMNNRETAVISSKMSNPNVITPLGQKTVTYGEPGSPDEYHPTETHTLNPEPQAALEAQQRVQHQLARLGELGVSTAQGTLATPFAPGTPQFETELDKSGLAAMPVNAGTTGQEAIMARVRPEMEYQDRLRENRLKNQGLVAGGEAYDHEMRYANQANNDMLSQAALQGINLDTAARNQGFNELTAEQSAENAARASDWQRQLATRQQPLNEITGLMSGSQIQLPQFQNFQGQQVQTSPIFQAAQAQNQSDMNQFGIAQSGKNAMISGLYGLAGAGVKGATGMKW